MSDKPKREITPHKGGRAKRFNGPRLTVKELAAVKAMIEESGLNSADWLVAAARNKDKINAIILEGRE